MGFFSCGLNTPQLFFYLPDGDCSLPEEHVEGGGKR